MPLLFSFLLLPIFFCCKKEAVKVIPTITIAAVTNITATTATCGGEITSDGGATVTARGVCWVPNLNPTNPNTSDNKTTNGTGSGSFTSSISGLIPGATYLIMAYATNSVGTSYSNESTFTTVALAPVLTTADLSFITSTSVFGGGNITNDGGAPVTSRGICWGTTHNPTISINKTSDGIGSGNFISALTGLIPGTLYYIRAYATNSVGTSYGNEINFTTTIVLGDYCQGGKVFYIFQAGDPGYIAGQTHGLIAALGDYIGTLRWSNGSDVTTGATATALGSGKANTNAIVAIQGAGSYAAKWCTDYINSSDYISSSYNDWYLPSKDELNILYINRNHNIGLANAQYWSSSEVASGAAWLQIMSVGQTFTAKTVYCNVRAIRSF